VAYQVPTPWRDPRDCLSDDYECMGRGENSPGGGSQP
jgi:hypothetical protein